MSTTSPPSDPYTNAFEHLLDKVLCEPPGSNVRQGLKAAGVTRIDDLIPLTRQEINGISWNDATTKNVTKFNAVEVSRIYRINEYYQDESVITGATIGGWFKLTATGYAQFRAQGPTRLPTSLLGCRWLSLSHPALLRHR